MDFKGVELFKVGTWTDSKGVKRAWTQKDLDGIAKAYAETKDDLHAPIKLGHNDKQKLLDDEPAAGWVENIRRVGSSLVGDFMRVPDKIGKLIESGAFRSRSVELNPDFEVGDKKYDWMLTAVALLGAHLPAISGLQDIVSLYETSGLELNSEIVLFEEQSEEGDLAAELNDIFSRLEGVIKNRRGAPQIRALQSALHAAIQSTKNSRSSNEMDRSKLAVSLGLAEDATEEQIEEKIKGLTAPPAVDPKKEESDNSANEKRIIALEKQIATQEVEHEVDGAIRAGKLLPKQREMAVKMGLRDIDDFKAFIASQPDNLVEFGERGAGTKTEFSLAKYEPTESEVFAAKQMNLWTPEWRITLMKNKMAAEGIEIPADFGKVPAGAGA